MTDPPECPRCKVPLSLRVGGPNGAFYSCPNWPRCDMAVGCHPGTDEALGFPADSETRRWRSLAHAYFDKTWAGPTARMTRDQAYEAMARSMCLSPDQAHIGKFDIDQCKQLMRLMGSPPPNLGLPAVNLYYKNTAQDR